MSPLGLRGFERYLPITRAYGAITMVFQVRERLLFLIFRVVQSLQPSMSFLGRWLQSVEVGSGDMAGKRTKQKHLWGSENPMPGVSS